MGWTENFQRAYLAAVITGRMGEDQRLVTPHFFTGAIGRLATKILTYRQSEGRWPGRDAMALFDEPVESSLVRSVTEENLEWAARNGVDEVRRQGLIQYACWLSEQAEGNPAEWNGEFVTRLEETLSIGTKRAAPFVYGNDAAKRHHTPDVVPFGFGVGELDRIKGQGILPGELVLVMGPTKSGKSHVSVAIAAWNLMRGANVLYISLENDNNETSKRFDRSMTRMTSQEICADEIEFHRRWQAALNDPDRLKVEWYPRYSINASFVRDRIKKMRDKVDRLLVVVDYVMILQHMIEGREDQMIADSVARLSAIAGELQVPIISPFQTNRQALIASSTGLEHAGGSFAAMAHPDVILTLEQSMTMKDTKQMKIHVTGARNSGSGTATVYFDPARTLMREWND